MTKQDAYNECESDLKMVDHLPNKKGDKLSGGDPAHHSSLSLAGIDRFCNVMDGVDLCLSRP